MDPELLKQREAFKKRAAAQPTIAKRPAEPAHIPEASVKREAKKPKTSKASALPGNLDLKVTASSSANFGTLMKIVELLKKRHLERIAGALSLDEVLEELCIFSLDARTRKWLKEALPQNKRVSEVELGSGRFEYRPPYNIKGKNALLKQLRKLDMEGRGGILLSELGDCIANAEKVVTDLGDAVISVTTQVNKKKDRVIFYNDPESALKIEQEFKERWRMVAVDHLDEKKVEEYLMKHGIDSVSDSGTKKGMGGPKRKAGRRGRRGVVHNQHLSGVLQDYSTPS